MNAMRTLVLAACLLPAAAPAAERPAPGHGGPGTVTLPLADFDRLTAQAARPTRGPDAPPVGAAVGSVVVRVRVDGGNAQATARVEGEVYGKGTMAVPIVPAAVALLDVRAGGRAVPLQRGEGHHSAMLSGPGRFELDLDFALAVQAEAGSASVTIPAFVAGSVRAEIDVPGGGRDVRVAPGVAVSRTVRSGRSVVEAALDPGKPARVSWTSRDPAVPASPHGPGGAVPSPAPREARWLAEVKTLVTLEESDVLLTCLVDVDVLQGEPARFDVGLPPGFEIVDVFGPTLDDTDRGTPDRLGLVITQPGLRRRHQFLLLLERAIGDGALRPPLISVAGAQRETGEVAVEGAGTLELDAKEAGTLRRIDVRELAADLRALARHPVLAGFRYHRRSSEPPVLELVVRRFPDAPLLPAVAQRATVTTLMATQGRLLTDITLRVRNHAQPFVKVELPEGAQILSAEVEGRKVKPVAGEDGTRVPLLRAGFRPSGPYDVSFVYTAPAPPLHKKGRAQLTLARVDIPIEVMEWEVFLPDRYRVRLRGGNVAPAEEVGRVSLDGVDALHAVAGSAPGTIAATQVESLALNGRNFSTLLKLIPGAAAVFGTVSDESGAMLPGVTLTATGEQTGVSRTATTDAAGQYVIAGLSPGTYRLRGELSGFRAEQRGGIEVTPSHAARVNLTLRLGAMTETVEVAAGSVEYVDRLAAMRAARAHADARREAEEDARTAPSANVMNVQRRAAGVLPVQVDVPRTGTSHRFVRPLVLGDETTLMLEYRRR